MKTALSSVFAIIISGALIGGAIMLTRSDGTASTDNVSIVNGKQIVEVIAKGSYLPKLTAAKADIPTTLRVKTNGTFDCTAALKVASVGFEQILPPSGVTDIEIPAQQAGTTVQGICAMGMYSFQIQFQ